jgi:hypothetical protein
MTESVYWKVNGADAGCDGPGLTTVIVTVKYPAEPSGGATAAVSTRSVVDERKVVGTGWPPGG